MKTVEIEFSLNGCRGRTTILAPTSIDGLLQWLETVPPNAGIRALVKVLDPVRRGLACSGTASLGRA